MNRPRASLVLRGQVVIAALPGGIETAEAIGLADGRVVSAGRDREVVEAAARGAAVIDARNVAIVPGIHDFHLHLVGMARSRRALQLDQAPDFAELLERVSRRAAHLAPDAWLTGRGWSEASLDAGALRRLEAAVGERPAFLYSHDGHSAWASAVARRHAGIAAGTPDPSGGRLEREASGEPNGILREAATELVGHIAARLQGDALADAIDETLAELGGMGITAATDAGDYDDANGVGEYFAFGDSFSSLAELAPRIAPRLRLTLDIPSDAIAAAAEHGLRTGAPFAGLRFGWAKAYADGALGSRTAALFAPYSCDEAAGSGILRLGPDQLHAMIGAARPAGIGLAIHAIGDRAAAAVLDAVEAAPPRIPGAVSDRLEHAQLVRPLDRSRFAALGVTASMQPIHAAADHGAVDRCWAGRAAHAFAWRSLAGAGALLAFGSDAPFETVNPWLGLFAAVRRRFPGEAGPGWHTEEALDSVTALSAYTLAPARAFGALDEGHLRPGAHADLAVMSIDLPTLLAADERLATAHADLTLVAGHEAHRS
ncbi:MAG: amidohydrolase [Chloroflexota bacterium]|nr:amidohydrolase [Chloroflexota bacterium]